MPPENSTSPWGLPFPSGVGKVNLGATDFNELATKLNTIFNEKLLLVKTHATEFTAVGGELAVATATLTGNLPLATTANRVICIFKLSGTTTVKTTGGEFIVGDNSEGTQVTLGTRQHVLMQSDGVRWLIIAGTLESGAVYGVLTSRTSGTEYEASSARAVFVMIEALRTTESTTPTGLEVFVGGVNICEFFISGVTALNTTMPVSFICPPGAKWKAVAYNCTIKSSYLNL